MGCFPVANVKARKKMVNRNQSMISNPLSLYDNKPVVLPQPFEIIEEAKFVGAGVLEKQMCTRTVSAPPSISNTRRSSSQNYQSTIKKFDATSYATSTSVTMLEQSQKTSVASLSSYPSTSPSPSTNSSFLSVNSPNLRLVYSPSIHSVADRWPESPASIRTFGGLPVPLPPVDTIMLQPLPLPVPCDKLTESPALYKICNIPSALRVVSSPCSNHLHTETGSDQHLKVSASFNMPDELSSPSSQKNVHAQGSAKDLHAQESAAMPFLFEELAAACQNFSCGNFMGHSRAGAAYKGLIHGKSKEKPKAICIIRSRTSMNKEAFLAEINRLSQLRHPNVCKLVGFCMTENNQLSDSERVPGNEFLLAYEQLAHGNLDKLLNIKELDKPALDWSTRLKVAVDAARGLVSLHENASGEILHKDFKLNHVQVDESYNAKIMGYGFVETILPHVTSLINECVIPNQTAENGRVSSKGNVWSFGVLLLQLLTGRKNLQEISQNEQKDSAYLLEFLKTYSKCIPCLESQSKNHFFVKAVNLVADLTLKCLRNEPELRPSMKEVEQVLSSAQSLIGSELCQFHAPVAIKTIHKEKSTVNANFSGLCSHNSKTVPLTFKITKHFSLPMNLAKLQGLCYSPFGGSMRSPERESNSMSEMV